MKLVRSVVGKVSNNRSIRNRQSRELCTSLRNNKDGNSTKELRGVRVLCDVFRKGAGLAIAYGPYAALGGALTSIGWYAHAYAIADRDTEETKMKVLNLDTEIQDLKARLEKSDKRSDEMEKRAEKEKQALKVIDTLVEKSHTHSEAIRKKDEIIIDMAKKLVDHKTEQEEVAKQHSRVKPVDPAER